jgi:hypothetical protein
MSWRPVFTTKRVSFIDKYFKLRINEKSSERQYMDKYRILLTEIRDMARQAYSEPFRPPIPTENIHRFRMLVKVAPLLEMVGNWRSFLATVADVDRDRLRQHERTGRPLGQDAFVEELEADLKRPLRPQKPGPKKTRGE